MPRPQIISDEEIQQAARAVFLEHGPAAPVAEVAARLGVSPAALFSRVGSKEELMRQALCGGPPPALARLLAPPPSRDIPGCLLDILSDLQAGLHRVVPGLVILRAAGISLPAPPTPEPPPVLLRRALAGWLEAACRQGSLRLLPAAATAEGLLGAMEARCLDVWLAEAPPDPEGDAAFLRGLVAGLVEGKAAPRG